MNNYDLLLDFLLKINDYNFLLKIDHFRLKMSLLLLWLLFFMS